MGNIQIEVTNLAGTVRLHNGVEMPYLGLGTMNVHNTGTIAGAVDAGYRLLDTAMIYENEAVVGEAIRTSSVSREDLFVTSKVWNSDMRSGSTFEAFEASLERLGLDYLDLYLVHWPVAGKYKDAYQAVEKLYADGRVRAIGVSNFMQHHMEDLLADAEIVPMVNQMEFHPLLIQQDLVDFCAEKGIWYQAWSPLMSGQVVEVEMLRDLAAKYDHTVAQIVLRWSLQKGVMSIPKSGTPERILENAGLFDFELSDEDVALIDTLDAGKRVGPDPETFKF